MRALGNDDEQVVVTPCPSSSLMSLGGGSCVETAEKNHLQLAFGCEGGGGGGRGVGRAKKTTSGSRLDVREVGGGCRVETMKRTASGSRLEAREVVVVAVVSKRQQ